MSEKQSMKSSGGRVDGKPTRRLVWLSQWWGIKLAGYDWCALEDNADADPLRALPGTPRLGF